MDQAAQHWTWMRREFLHKSLHFQVSGVSWEEKAFAEDAAGGLGGCVWPPRVYSCSFCRREFRSAQALGGHMNVHRRDRARLKRSLSGQNEEVILHSLKPFPTEKYCDAISGNISKVSDHSDGWKGDDYGDDCVETSLSVGRSTNRTGLGCGDEAIRFSKRPRTGGLNQLPPPFVPGDATFLGVKAAKDLELDLELRLGDFH